MGSFTHLPSRANLLGPHPTPELIALLSNELQVTADTPPCFIWHTADDRVVPVRNSLEFAIALAAHKVPFELHVYPHGPHGQGLGVHGYDPAQTDSSRLLPWTHALDRWLREGHFGR